MPIRYTLRITDWTIPDEIPIWDDDVGPGNYPQYLDENGRQYSANFRIGDEEEGGED